MVSVTGTSGGVAAKWPRIAGMSQAGAHAEVPCRQTSVVRVMSPLAIAAAISSSDNGPRTSVPTAMK